MCPPVSPPTHNDDNNMIYYCGSELCFGGRRAQNDASLKRARSPWTTVDRNINQSYKCGLQRISNAVRSHIVSRRFFLRVVAYRYFFLYVSGLIVFGPGSSSPMYGARVRESRSLVADGRATFSGGRGNGRGLSMGLCCSFAKAAISAEKPRSEQIIDIDLFLSP